VAGSSTAFTGQGTDLLLLRYRQQDVSGRFLLGLTRLGDGAFQFSTPPETNFVVEASSDLIQWTPATDSELQNLFDLRNPNPPPLPQRFFRLVRPGIP
jgi:hypothetical protein